MASNAEVARQYFAPYDGVDFKAPVEDAIRSATDSADAIARMGEAWATLSPEIEWDTSPIAGEGPATKFYGYKGFLDFWGEWLSVWDEYVYTVVDYIDRGDTIVADLEIRAVGRDGVSAEWKAAQVCDIRDGKIVRMRVFPATAAALESLAIAEGGAA